MNVNYYMQLETRRGCAWSLLLYCVSGTAVVTVYTTHGFSWCINVGYPPAFPSVLVPNRLRQPHIWRQYSASFASPHCSLSLKSLDHNDCNGNQNCTGLPSSCCQTDPTQCHRINWSIQWHWLTDSLKSSDFSPSHPVFDQPLFLADCASCTYLCCSFFKNFNLLAANAGDYRAYSWLWSRRIVETGVSREDGDIVFSHFSGTRALIGRFLRRRVQKCHWATIDWTSLEELWTKRTRLELGGQFTFGCWISTWSASVQVFRGTVAALLRWRVEVLGLG